MDDEMNKRLIDSIHLLRRMLTIEEPLRQDQVLRGILPLITEVERSAEKLFDVAAEQADELVKMLRPLREFAEFQEKASTMLKCLGKSDGFIRGATKRFGSMSRLEDSYHLLKDGIESLTERNRIEIQQYLRRHKQTLTEITQSLENRLIGDLLEQTYLPKIVESEGYRHT